MWLSQPQCICTCRKGTDYVLCAPRPIKKLKHRATVPHKFNCTSRKVLPTWSCHQWTPHGDTTCLHVSATELHGDVRRRLRPQPGPCQSRVLQLRCCCFLASALLRGRSQIIQKFVQLSLRCLRSILKHRPHRCRQRSRRLHRQVYLHRLAVRSRLGHSDVGPAVLHSIGAHAGLEIAGGWFQS